MARPVIRHTHFDMDGVIVNTEPLHVLAEKQTCLDNGFDVKPKDWKNFKGRRSEDIFTYLANKYGGSTEYDIQELITQKTNYFMDLADHKLKPIRGAIKFLNEERERRETVNLVTSSNNTVQQFVVNKLGIAGLFDYVVTGDDVVQGKPHAEPYRRAVLLSEGDPSESLVIEDSDNGITSALGAKCLVAAIATSHTTEKLKEFHPYLVAPNYPYAREMIDTLWPPKSVR